MRADRRFQLPYDRGVFGRDVADFARIARHIVEFKRLEWVVLQQFPSTADERLVRFPDVLGPAFSASEVEIARPFYRAAVENRDEAHRVQLRRRGAARRTLRGRPRPRRAVAG